MLLSATPMAFSPRTSALIGCGSASMTWPSSQQPALLDLIATFCPAM
jgi:hypothetical protein